MFPPLPPWEAAHPILVHIPLGVLFIVPVFLVLAAVWWHYRHAFAVSALVLMVIGVIGAYLAVESGESAHEYAEENMELTEAVHDHIHEHEESAELSLYLFAGLTVLYTGVAALPLLFKKVRTFGVRASIHFAFLVLYVFALGQLANTGHLGGTLVHEHGILAPLGGVDHTREAPEDQAPTDHEHEEGEEREHPEGGGAEEI